MIIRGKLIVYQAFTVLSFLTVKVCYAQDYPPLSFGDQDLLQTSIYTVNPFRFGVFYPGYTGGSITLSEDGMRTSTGTVVILHQGIVGPAVFEITTAASTMIQLNYENEIHLTSSTGASLLLVPGELSRGNPFISPPDAESGFMVTLGGTIEISGSTQNPPGEYSGTLQVSIVVE